MSIDVLALVRLTPERVAALTAAGYAGSTPFATEARPSVPV